jgi:hypothetical protein
LQSGKMKAVFSLLVLVATMNLVHASAGPRPFTNGSPLDTGTDGTYQAVASGTNLTGVFSFVISGGIQTSTSSSVINSWVFFIDGFIVQGPVVAAISKSSVVGILSGGTSQSLTTGSNGSVTLPTAFIVPGNTASGSFSGNIALKSPIGAFNGYGTLEGAPDRVDKLVLITEPTQSVVSNGVVVPGNTNAVTVTDIVIPGSDFATTRFRFQGTRVSTTPATAGSDSSAASPTATPSSSG